MRRDLSDIDRDIGQDWSRILQDAAAHGMTNDQIFGGLESDQSTMQGLYEQSATKICELGTRRVTWDGRVFRYAKASNIITRTQFGVKFWALQSEGIEANLSQGQDSGDESILIAGTNIAENELVGGYVIIHTTSGKFRCITANTAIVGAGNITITLDGSLDEDVANATYTEVYPNPYAKVYCHYSAGGHPAGSFSSVAGMPNVVTPAANRYLWIQTWGPIFINPYGNVGSNPAHDNRELVFDHEGAVAYRFAAKGYGAGSTDEYQCAGFVINRQTDSVAGPPLVMLQISP